MSNRKQKFLPAISNGICDQWTDWVSASILQTVMMPLFSQAPVSVPTWFACSVSALESWKFNPESQWATEPHPPPAPINCVLGEVEEMLSIRTSGNPTPKQCSLSQKPQTSANSSLQAHHPFRQDSLEKKKKWNNPQPACRIPYGH